MNKIRKLIYMNIILNLKNKNRNNWGLEKTQKISYQYNHYHK